MKVRLTLMIIFTLIGVVSGAKLLIQRYNLFTGEDIPALSYTTDNATVVDAKQSNNTIQYHSQPTSTPQVKSGQSKTVKPTSARRDKMKTEANSKVLEFAQPAINYAESIEKFKLAVEYAEASVKRLESIDY